MNDIDVNEFIDETEELTFIQKVVGMVSDPKPAFESIKNSPKIMAIYLFTVLFSLIPIVWNYFDGSAKELILEQFKESGQPITEELINVTTIGGVVGGIVAITLLPFLVAFFYHIFAMIQSHTGYKKTLAIYLYSSIVSLIGQWIILIVTKFSDMTIAFSPAMFLDPVSVSPILYAIIASLDLFVFWTMFVMFVGFRSVHDMNKKEATLAVAAPYVLSIIIGIVLIALFT
jgi:LytS/YehU family sensor histidine kinase